MKPLKMLQLGPKKILKQEPIIWLKRHLKYLGCKMRGFHYQLCNTRFTYLIRLFLLFPSYDFKKVSTDKNVIKNQNRSSSHNDWGY